MTAKAGASSSPIGTWDQVNWSQVDEEVRRLQTRIAQAVQQKRWGKVKSLQWLLTHSYHAKLLAIKRVTTNKGRNTPGVDGVLWRTPRQKMQAVERLSRHGYHPQPLRRIYIPKKDPTKLRPLSIPTMIDRAMQALYMQALLPVAETQADRNSYGFRPYRCCADAMQQCFVCLSGRHSAEYILEGDIKACFDRISHEWLMANIPLDKEILRKFLSAGYMEQGQYHDSRDGTPQGGIISPVLANMTLDGLEEVVRKSVPYRSRVNFVRFADDFMVTAKSEELLTTRTLPAITSFLQPRGLELSPTKTLITHITTGFDFLGQHVRKYRDGKVRTTPSRSAIEQVRETIRQTLKRARGWPVKNMIKALNSRTRGWANYHRWVAAKETFHKLDWFMGQAIWRWLRRRHPKKSNKWLRSKYWTARDPSTLSVTAKEEKNKRQVYRVYRLLKFSSVKIRRYIKIRGDANPYDPAAAAYFIERRTRKRSRPA